MEYSAAMDVRASSKDRFAGASSTPVYVSPSPRISLALGQFQSEMKNKKIFNFTLQAEQHTLNNSIHLLWKSWEIGYGNPMPARLYIKDKERPQQIYFLKYIYFEHSV